jgi:hypothetical protein
MIKSLPSILVTSILLASASNAFGAQSIRSFPAISIVVDADNFIEKQVSCRQSIEWSSDKPWTMSLFTLDSGELMIGPSDQSMKNIRWKLSNSESWSRVTAKETSVCSGNPGNGIIYIDFSWPLSWNSDAPGRYAMKMQFKIRPANRMDGKIDLIKLQHNNIENLTVHDDTPFSSPCTSRSGRVGSRGVIQK